MTLGKLLSLEICNLEQGNLNDTKTSYFRAHSWHLSNVPLASFLDNKVFFEGANFFSALFEGAIFLREEYFM